MVNGNDWEEKNGTRNRTGPGPAKGSQGGGKTLFFGFFLFLLFLLLFFFFFLFMDTNFGIPTRQGSSQSFFGGEGGFSFQKKGSVRHSLPSVTLVSSLVVVLF